MLREAQYVFNYTATERVNEVSLTMPIRAQSYASKPLMPVFSMNLPEGYLFDLIVRRIAKHELVTTTIYPHYNQRTGEARVDRTTALKLFSGARTRLYPTREDLLRFGKTICLVNRPEQVIERIGTAMSETLAANRSRLETEYGARLAQEWEQARFCVSPTRRHRAHPD